MCPLFASISAGDCPTIGGCRREGGIATGGKRRRGVEDGRREECLPGQLDVAPAVTADARDCNEVIHLEHILDSPHL